MVADSTPTTVADATANRRVPAVSRGAPAATNRRRLTVSPWRAADMRMAEANRRDGSVTMLRPMASTNTGLAS